MHYEVMLKSKAKDSAGGFKRVVYYQENFLPGMKIPERVVPMLMADFAEKQLDLCKSCPLDIVSHPLDENGCHYCTVLLHDAVKPKWKIKNLC